MVCKRYVHATSSKQSTHQKNLPLIFSARTHTLGVWFRYAVIERKKENFPKNSPPWCLVPVCPIMGRKNKFEVIEIGSQNFINFGSLSKNMFVWRKLSGNVGRFSWSDVKRLRYSNNIFGYIQYTEKKRTYYYWNSSLGQWIIHYFSASDFVHCFQWTLVTNILSQCTRS